MTFREFERRVAAEPDLELSPYYWNWLVPLSAPRYWWWWLCVQLNLVPPSEPEGQR